MPRRIDPPADRPELVQLAVTVFGNEAKHEIVRYLADGQASYLGAIVEGTRLPRSTVTPHLSELEDLGVVIGDIPHGQRKGRSVLYTVNRERMAELLEAWVTYVFGAESVNYFLDGGYIAEAGHRHNSAKDLP
ncbi:helix-turn-helix domain-containing protein [Isoptericola sp. F-RaC21]|uniref:ArsR/SmtB family transcription factor n=1 Tax=Isoptericola sp. F-RaC21 TaxID=3141452 RepID=UPI00315C3070